MNAPCVRAQGALPFWMRVLDYAPSIPSPLGISRKVLPMSEAKTIAATVSENGKSPYSVDITVSGHALTGDEPESFGGGDLGPAPYDMLLAALGECTAMTVRWYAIQQKWPLEHVAVSLTHRKVKRAELSDADKARLPTAGQTGDRVPPLVDVFDKEITITGHSLSAEQKQKLHDVAVKCPVQRTLINGALVNTADLTPALT